MLDMLACVELQTLKLSLDTGVCAQLTVALCINFHRVQGCQVVKYSQKYN